MFFKNSLRNLSGPKHNLQWAWLIKVREILKSSLKHDKNKNSLVEIITGRLFTKSKKKKKNMNRNEYDEFDQSENMATSGLIHVPLYVPDLYYLCKTR